MPRHIDPDLERKVLEAARNLWHKGGEKALSMRAVAEASGTNTPAVYRRFRRREDILRALVLSYQQELFSIVEPCTSLSEIADCILEFALKRPLEYQLMMSGLLGRMTRFRPNVELVLKRSAEWLGGVPSDYRELIFAIWSMLHGFAMLSISGTLPEEDCPTARAAVMSAVDVLIANRRKLRGRGKA
jgi:AcrR family transcriptional regulator